MKATIHQAFLCLPLSMILMFTFIACKKNINPQDPPVTITPLVRPKGTSTGMAISKEIGIAGGTIQWPGGQVRVQIPEGALSNHTAIGIERLSNTNIAGIGYSYRLTPHGQIFNKPVTVTFSWADIADSVGLLQTLGLSYQMDDGIWKFVGADAVDTEAKTVSFKSTHFSDWSLMNRISLSPYRADLETGEKKTIQAMIFTEAGWDNLFIPLVNNPNGPYNEPGYPVGNPAPLPSKFIKSWELTGPGSLNKSNQQSVEYQAPASVNGTATANVSLELNAPVSGKFLLTSTMNIMGDGWIELSINNSAPVRFPATPVVKMGSRYILSNPEDEGGGHFLLTWKGELGSHAFDLAADGTRFHFLTATTGYNAFYMPGPDMPPQPSEGNVTVTKLGNGRAEGSFTISNVGVGDKFKPEATAKGSFSAKLFIP
ncbi:hypothetical protein U0035_08675 [Niabella yanshanensis]|uniref:ZU5 domain-containing protein n=1 Tax=Niabella yanshanensis TaxID=577386 RepID=A0ABZ0WD33_9BACT|nr:hypothetical protein [Niabella yanshanensis]WQD40217.1 hypothetical protein U0035_08675 [Niabella yanshanensis]